MRRELNRIIGLLIQLNETMRRIDRKLEVATEQREEVMADLSALATEVNENKDAIASAVELLNGLSQQLKDAVASNDPAAVQALVDQLDTQTQSLAEAVVNNTAASSPPPEEPPPADPNAPRVDNTLPGDLPPDDEPHVEHRRSR